VSLYEYLFPVQISRCCQGIFISSSMVAMRRNSNIYSQWRNGIQGYSSRPWYPPFESQKN